MKKKEFIVQKLGNIVDIKTGKLDANASSENGKYPFFTCSINPLKINSYSYDCECILVAGNGDLNVKYYNGKFDAYQRTYIIESKDKQYLNTKYLYYFMSKYIEVLRNQSIGGVIKYIKLGNLTEAEIPIPSLEEQNKIIEVLEMAEKTLEKRKRTINLLDELVKSQFIEMFGNPSINDKEWIIDKLSTVVTNIENGKSFVCESFSRSGRYPAILKLSAVTYGIYNANENKALTDESLYVSSVEVKSEDLLFTRKNTPELVGMSAYVYNTEPNLMMPDLIFRFNTNKKINKIYLWKLINHDLFREKIKSLSNGSAKSMSNISKQRLMELNIPIPPIELQNQFADFVKQTDKLKFEMEKSLKELEDSFNSLMQRAFKGELFN